jgi:hypothetical protein
MAAWAALACAGGGPVPVPPGGSVLVPPAASLAFYQHANVFYDGLKQRRFNTLETYNDPLLRDQFRTENQFFDYYADLAESLDAADFERARPTSVAIQGFLFETPSLVHVQVRFVGEDDRPLRPNKTALLRLDRWERVEGRWWLAPEKL